MAQEENRKSLEATMEKVRVYQNKRKTAENVPSPEQIRRFTMALDDYAEEVLPSRRSKPRSMHSPSFSTVYMERRTVTPSSAESVSRASDTASIRVYATPRKSSPRALSRIQNLDSTETSNSTLGKSKSRKIATPGSSQRRVSAAQRADTTIKRPEMSPREYMNDRSGTILSPPITKTRPADMPAPTTGQVGPHKIVLGTKTFQINANTPLKFTSYAAADALFGHIVSRRDEADRLDEQLSSGCQQNILFNLPNWRIVIGGLRIYSNRLQ